VAANPLTDGAHLAPVETQTVEVAASSPAADRSVLPDYFVRQAGAEFAGLHLLVDLWDAHGLDDIALVERAMREAVEACEATLLNLHLHHFGETQDACGEAQGVSGVAVLAESHISIHTWPERGYAAVDIFMCGACDPHAAVPVFERHFKSGSVEVNEAKRGLVR